MFGRKKKQSGGSSKPKKNGGHIGAAIWGPTAVAAAAILHDEIQQPLAYKPLGLDDPNQLPPDLNPGDLGKLKEVDLHQFDFRHPASYFAQRDDIYTKMNAWERNENGILVPDEDRKYIRYADPDVLSQEYESNIYLRSPFLNYLDEDMMGVSFSGRVCRVSPLAFANDPEPQKSAILAALKRRPCLLKWTVVTTLENISEDFAFRAVERNYGRIKRKIENDYLLRIKIAKSCKARIRLALGYLEYAGDAAEKLYDVYDTIGDVGSLVGALQADARRAAATSDIEASFFELVSDCD